MTDTEFSALGSWLITIGPRIINSKFLCQNFSTACVAVSRDIVQYGSNL